MTAATAACDFRRYVAAFLDLYFAHLPVCMPWLETVVSVL